MDAGVGQHEVRGRHRGEAVGGVDGGEDLAPSLAKDGPPMQQRRDVGPQTRREVEKLLPGQRGPEHPVDARKRGGGEAALALEELQDCLSDQETPETQAEGKLLSESIQAFVCRLPDLERRAFLLRYWHLYSLEETADKLGCSKSKVNSMLFRTRVKLKNHLIKEGLF